VYYCPYHPLYGVAEYRYDSPDRKPRPGMLLRAQADFNLDLASSILIGDKLSDIEAAKAAGVGTMILLRSGATDIDVAEHRCHVSHSLDDVRLRFFPVCSHENA
jgi:D-glycero-D-manno-heptose 1,7-bisphosphate phosphatase